jgi:hypothetical protein
MKIAKTRIVFDRHNNATKKVAAAIYVEVSYNRVRNFYNTGIKVCSHQFKDGKVINCGQMAEYQDRINDMRSTIETYINDRIKEKETFSLDNLKKFKCLALPTHSSDSCTRESSTVLLPNRRERLTSASITR